MKNKILLSIAFCFTVFLAAFSLNEVSAATNNHKYMSIKIPSAYDNDYKYISSSEDDEYSYRNYYVFDGSIEKQIHYNYSAGYSILKEYTSSDVVNFAKSIEESSYESDNYIVKYTVISKGLVYIDGVATIRVRYERKSYNKNYKDYTYTYNEVFLSQTDHCEYEFSVGVTKDAKAYLDSEECKNIIKSIVIKDTVANTRITPFKDVQKSAWYYNAVKYNWKNKIINGTNAYTFSPNAKVTRGMVVTMLYSMAGAPKVTATNKFSDVSSSKYYYNAVRWATANNIATGYAGTSKFGPEDSVTREQLAVMLSSYAKYKNKYTASNYGLTSFSDSSKVSSWALPAVRWAVKNGIINGSNGKLNPKGNATRAEVATMIYSYCLKFGK